MHTWDTMSSRNKYLISIATFRRPADLKRLLDSLLVTLDVEAADVVIVDNDAEATAQSIAADHPLRPNYVVESDPGIASARNKGLDFFTEQYIAIIFVDDDEWLDADWFETLVTYAEQTGAAAVQGPVITVLPIDAPPWIRRGAFFQRPIPPTGTIRLTAATNNVILTREAWLRAGSPRFDPDFSMTGGSDWDFFWGIRKSGGTILFCAEALAYEDVPPSRLSWKWLRMRYKRNGMVILRARRKHGDPLAPFLIRTAGGFAVGAVQLVADLSRGRGAQALPIERIYRAFGVLQGLSGRLIYEYQRDPQPSVG